MDTLLNIKYKISNNDPGQQLQNISVLTGRRDTGYKVP